MRWFGQVYIPMMAVIGLLLIISAFVTSLTEDRASSATHLFAGAILAAGACIGGAIQHGKS